MDADLVEMLRLSLRKVLTEGGDRPLADRLDELGWDEVVAGDEAGARRLLFAARGETLAAADVLGVTMVGVLADRLADPSLGGAGLVLPTSLRPDHSAAERHGDTLTVRGLSPSASASPAAAGALVIPLVEDGSTLLAVVPAGAAGIECQPAGGIDRHGGVVAVQGSLPLERARVLEGPEVGEAWAAAVAIGRAGLATELVALARQVIDAVVSYTGERLQYGKPIGSFQALQHRLAAAYATVNGAAAVTDEASASGDRWNALVAKTLAGRAAEGAATQAQQAYGAIGFTWEHDFHDHLRRIYVLDRLLGDWRSLEAEVGRELRAKGNAPKIGGL